MTVLITQRMLGQCILLLSKNGISVDTTGGELHGIMVSQNESGAYTFTDIETSTLLFALETIDANSYGA